MKVQDLIEKLLQLSLDAPTATVALDLEGADRIWEVETTRCLELQECDEEGGLLWDEDDEPILRQVILIGG